MKKNQKDSSNFWHRKNDWRSELCCFRASILKLPMGQKYFHVHGYFHSVRSWLFTTKLNCLQKNNFGHTKPLFKKYMSDQAVLLPKWSPMHLRISRRAPVTAAPSIGVTYMHHLLCGFMSNLHKKSLMVSNEQVHCQGILCKLSEILHSNIKIYASLCDYY